MCVFDLLCWAAAAAGLFCNLRLSDVRSNIYLRICNGLEERNCTLSFLYFTNKSCGAAAAAQSSAHFLKHWEPV